MTYNPGVPSKKNQSVLIAKNSFLQNTKNPKSTKINFRKNFVPHGIPMQASASPEQPLRCCPEPLDLPGLPVVSF